MTSKLLAPVRSGRRDGRSARARRRADEELPPRDSRRRGSPGAPPSSSPTRTASTSHARSRTSCTPPTSGCCPQRHRSRGGGARLPRRSCSRSPRVSSTCRSPCRRAASCSSSSLLTDGSGPLYGRGDADRLLSLGDTHPRSPRRRRMSDSEARAPHAAAEAGRRRPADGVGPARGDAAPEVARAADLRVRPALVGRIRDRGGARRARRRLGGAAHVVFPISLAIAALLVIVVLSYRQTVQVYESSGGAYIVAKENLGRLPSLVAAAALLTDYVLTVAVSVAAGVLALTSAVSSLRGHELTLSLVCVLLIAVANLRGVKEAGLLFALPTYAFVDVDLRAGRRRARSQCATGVPAGGRPHPLASGAGARHRLRRPARVRVGLDRADGRRGDRERRQRVPPAARPQRRDDARSSSARSRSRCSSASRGSPSTMHARPTATGTPSVLSEIARGVFPSSSALGFMYWAVQMLTLAVLVLAANTSYQGFPRLAALLARDRFFARQFTNLGDRLVFSNGIVVLTAIAMRAAVGVRRERRLADPPLRDRRLHRVHAVAGRDGALLAGGRAIPAGVARSSINAVGATATGVVTLVVIWTKFAEGAWLVTVAIPLLVLMFLGINRHYRRFARRLRAGMGAVVAAGRPTNEVLLAVDAIDVATEGALWYARQIAPHDSIRALHRAGPPHRLRDPAALVRLRRGSRGSRSLPTAKGACSRCSRRCGACRAANRTSSRSSCPEQFKRRLAACRRRGATLVPAEAPAALGARRRRHRRAGGDRRRGPGRAARRASSPCACSSRTSTPARCARSTTRSRSASRTRGPCRSRSTSDEAARFARGDERRASVAARPAARRRTATSARRSSPTSAS